MKPIYRWIIWVVAAALIISSGNRTGWDAIHKVFLGLLLLLAVLNLIFPLMQRRMLLKIKALPPEEREKFLTRFDPKTQAKLRKQLET